MKLSVFGTRTDTRTSQNLYILATRAVNMKLILLRQLYVNFAVTEYPHDKTIIDMPAYYQLTNRLEAAPGNNSGLRISKRMMMPDCQNQ